MIVFNIATSKLAGGPSCQTVFCETSANFLFGSATPIALKLASGFTGHCVYTLYGHTSTVRCLALHEHM